jgi:hypothetical protein
MIDNKANNPRDQGGSKGKEEKGPLSEHDEGVTSKKPEISDEEREEYGPGKMKKEEETRREKKIPVAEKEEQEVE